MSDINIAKTIDHTLLKPDATSADIANLCDEAAKYGFYSVAVNSCWTRFCVERLHDTDVKVTTCIGFPLGAMDTETKAFEATRAVEEGTDEIDMVLNIGKLLEGDIEYIINDIACVVEHSKGVTLKVILECCLLNNDQIVDACKACIDAGADYVKTSTGFSTGGATVEDVKLMYDTVSGDGLKVKAAGGIHTHEEALAMLEAGADRIGASSGIAICSQQ